MNTVPILRRYHHRHTSTEVHCSARHRQPFPMGAICQLHKMPLPHSQVQLQQVNHLLLLLQTIRNILWKRRRIRVTRLRWRKVLKHQCHLRCVVCGLLKWHLRHEGRWHYGSKQLEKLVQHLRPRLPKQPNPVLHLRLQTRHGGTQRIIFFLLQYLLGLGSNSLLHQHHQKRLLDDTCSLDEDRRHVI